MHDDFVSLTTNSTQSISCRWKTPDKLPFHSSSPPSLEVLTQGHWGPQVGMETNRPVSIEYIFILIRLPWR